MAAGGAVDAVRWGGRGLVDYIRTLHYTRDSVDPEARDREYHPGFGFSDIGFCGAKIMKAGQFRIYIRIGDLSSVSHRARVSGLRVVRKKDRWNILVRFVKEQKKGQWLTLLESARENPLGNKVLISVPAMTVQGWHTVTFSGEPVTDELLSADKLIGLPIFLDKAEISYEWGRKGPSKNKHLLAMEANLKEEFAERGRRV